MPLVLSDIRRPTFTICACVTSQIAKSFLFDRRSDLLSFRLVARPPPTQDPVHLTISRALTAPYDQQNMAFTVQPRFLLVDPTGSSIVLSASQRPFPGSPHCTHMLTRWAVFLPPPLFLLHFTITPPWQPAEVCGFANMLKATTYEPISTCLLVRNEHWSNPCCTIVMGHLQSSTKHHAWPWAQYFLLSKLSLPRSDITFT